MFRHLYSYWRNKSTFFQSQERLLCYQKCLHVCDNISNFSYH